MDLLAVLERRVQVKCFLTGDAEDVAHAFVLETADKKLGGVQEGIRTF